MKTYLITNGSFRMPDGSLKHTGETIELDDDVAQLHAEQLQVAEPEQQPAEQPQG
jgi:hypothetical protein